MLITAALFSDIKSYKIRNKLTFTFMIIGLILAIMEGGVQGFLDSLLGIVIPFVLLIILYALRMLGAGDIKLFSAVGAVMGWQAIIWIMIYSFLAGGCIAVFVIGVNKNAKKRFAHIFNYLKCTFLTRSIQPYSDFEIKDKKSMLKMAYAILCGTIIFIIRKHISSV
ncbi:MAG: prepilin peptidase [Clostridium sp.]|nr:prepilin peptidase [Clostridium sp.]